MNTRIYSILKMVSRQDRTYRELIYDAENHELHLWRVKSGEWIYPHTHPHTDDIWYIVQGEGEYYTGAKEKRKVKQGDLALASPGEVHGIFNSGSEDIIIYSVLSPLPVETDEAPGFEYPW
jgi:quercetin dioxygenase-like cupin family protein